MSHPTTGADILDYIDARGLKRLDACWLLGIPPWRFGKIINAHEQTPVANASMGVLFRLVTRWSEQAQLPEYPSLMQVYERVKALDSRISMRVFGMALGCHPSWASARLHQTDYSSPVIDRLLLLLSRRLDAAGTTDEARAAVHEWLHEALSEWRGRGDTRLDFIDG